jgi:O-antigen ligase
MMASNKLFAWATQGSRTAAILTAQIAMVALFAIDPRLCLAVVGGLVSVIVVLEWPLLGIGLLLAARLLSTGATVFVRIGKIGLGPFEPALLLCLLALGLHAVLHGLPLWRSWPWRAPFLAIAGWVALSLLWSVSKTDGLAEVLPLCLVLANTLVILAFVRTWSGFRLMLLFWLGASVLTGILAITVDALGIATTDVVFKAAEGGGRETGLGQQPNWFAMNLMFIVHTSFAMVLVERRTLRRLALLCAGFFVFVMMLKSGSRGGAYATLIGGLLIAMAHPLFRRWFLRFSALTLVIFVLGIAFDFGDSAKALTRISTNLSLNQNYRQLNWLACLQMFRDTYGLGIGAGGYEALLPQYNSYLASSLYDYPHGIYWEVTAHYGAVGLLLFAWLVVSVLKMSASLVRLSRGSDAEIFAWSMAATLLGYAAWCWVEFTVNEKPFWEFLALYTALYLWVRRSRDAGMALPPWSAPLRLSEPEPTITQGQASP